MPSVSPAVSAIDVAALGFKAGLEVHQRLDTRKLFCNCYCDPNKNDFKESFRLHRRLHAVASELGEMDPTARFEASRSKQFIYLIDPRYSCDVEADEEPPHALNAEALSVVLQASKQLSARVVDLIWVMRKQVLDGSSVSGFQRTALVATDGVLQTPQGNVGISSLCLEEESSGIVENSADSSTYRLDRQGIPLLEIATDPDLKSPAQVKAAALLLGDLLRATAKVQRGLGTIRQDLNVSISGGARVEIKGAQELKVLDKLVENEALRQHHLLQLKTELSIRKVALSSRDFMLVDVTDLLSASPSALIKKSLASGDRCFALKLKGFAGLFKKELMPAHTFGKEIAGYVRQHSTAKGYLHSDEGLQEKYGLSPHDLSALSKALACDAWDLYALCLGPQETCRKALETVFRRCQQALQGVPNETRRAEGETSVFMRPLPGASRMYPETDVLPVAISSQRLSSITAAESLDAKAVRYQKLGLNASLSTQMAKSPKFPLFESLLGAPSLQSEGMPAFIASTLLETAKSLQREGVDAESLAQADWLSLFELVANQVIVKAAVGELIKYRAKSPTSTWLHLVKQHHLHRFSADQLIAAFGTLPKDLPSERKFGEFMKRFRLNAEAQDASGYLNRNPKHSDPWPTGET